MIKPLLLLFLATSVWTTAHAAAPEKLPNIVIIFTDDQGYADVGKFGAEGFTTPNLDRMKDAWMRSAADFDNFRKRTRKELEDARRSGREDLLRAVLPVFDNLERAIQSALRTKDVKAVADGLAMVQRQFTEALGREGIARIATVGQPFDPSLHEAIQQVETSDHAPGTVLADRKSTRL